jgi:hypothetical protein
MTVPPPISPEEESSVWRFSVGGEQVLGREVVHARGVLQLPDVRGIALGAEHVLDARRGCLEELHLERDRVPPHVVQDGLDAFLYR